MELLDAPDDARPEGCAAVYEDDRLNIDVYLSALDESHEVQLTYLVHDAVLLHEDAAEFVWNLTSEKEAFDVDQITGRIIIPDGTREGGLYFWGHGPDGENAYFDAVPREDGLVSDFELYNEEITPDHPGYVRFAMPLELFPDGQRFSGQEALESILREEEPGAFPDDPEDPVEEPTEDPYDDPYDDPYYHRTWWQKVSDFFGYFCFRLTSFLTPLAIGLCVIPLLISIFFSAIFRKIGEKTYIRKNLERKRPKPVQAPQYYRGLPDDLKPAMVFKLASVYPGKEKKNVLKNGSAFSATVMDLVERDVIHMVRSGEDVAYQVPEIPDDSVFTEYEKVVLDIFTSAGAVETPQTTSDITSYMRSNYNWCKDRIRDFDRAVDAAFEASGLFALVPEKTLGRDRGIVIVICLGLIIMAGISRFSRLAGILMGAVFGALATVSISNVLGDLCPEYRVLTQDGENRYALWTAYGRFLDDFTTFDEREIPDVAVWKRYLVYAAALGRSVNVMEALKVRFPEVYHEFITSDASFCYYDDFASSVSAIDNEGGYTIRSGGSSGWSGSDSSDWGDGGWSDSGGSSDSGSDGSDFD